MRALRSQYDNFHFLRQNIKKTGGKSSWIKRKSRKYLTVLLLPVWMKKMHTVKGQPSPKLKMTNPQQLRGWYMMNMIRVRSKRMRSYEMEEYYTMRQFQFKFLTSTTLHTTIYQ